MPVIETGAAALILTAVLGYLLGSIPFGVLVTKLMGLGDLRKIGSGNIGATNVLRTGNKGAALATLLLDGGKGAVAVLLALAWPVGVAACLTWFATAVITRISSLSALVAAALAAVWAGFLGHSDMIWLIATLGTLVFFRHRANIERLMAGTEPKIGKK